MVQHTSSPQPQAVKRKNQQLRDKVESNLSDSKKNEKPISRDKPRNA